MAKLEILRYPDKRLRNKALPVTEFDASLRTLCENMAETMYAESGIGLAAPQLGLTKRITVIDVSADRSELIEFINPEITWDDGEVDSEEGCLSIPEFRETIQRREEVPVQAVDRHGESFEVKADELLSICLQHEIDHLNGVLFIDKLSRLKKEIFKKWHKKRARGGE